MTHARPLRIVCVHPGAVTSTADVCAGLMSALVARTDVCVAEYALGGRISWAGQFLALMYRRAKKADPEVVFPSPDDVIKRAIRDLPDAAWKHCADWILIVSGMFVHPDAIACLRWFNKVKLGLLLTESPYEDDRQRHVIGLSHLAWTNERSSLLGLRQVQPHTEYLPHAVIPALHRPGPVDPKTPRHDVVFVGTPFPERVEWLSAVDWTGIDLGLYGEWGRLPSRHRLRRFVKKGPVPNRYAVELYRAAKIGLNLHRQSMGWEKESPRLTTAESLNPRAYELAACGCFAISDDRPETHEVFGDLVPTFHDPRDLGPLIRRWLADDAGRAALAAQLPACVAAHTWDARVATMLEQMAAIGAGEAPAP